MKHRVLHGILIFLLMFSAYIGTDVRTAVFGETGGIQIVTVHTPAHEYAPAILGAAKTCERTVARPQKKSGLSLPLGEILFEKQNLSFCVDPVFAHDASSSRVLLLPKSLQTIIFQQTVI